MVLMLIIIVLPFIIIPSITSRKAKQRRLGLIQLSELFADELQDGTWYPVRYASFERFNKIWKFFPWEDYGILNIKEDAITYYSIHNGKFVFPPGHISITWTGTKYWPNGILSWFLIKHEQTDHYFTSETGMYATKSRAMTKEVFDKIKEIFP